MNPIAKTNADVGGQSGSVSIKRVLNGALVISVLMNLYFLVGPKYYQSSITITPRGSHKTQSSAQLQNVGVNNSSLPPPPSLPAPPPINVDEENELRVILEQTAIMPNKTVILTYLNEAWIAPNSMFDLFLESFHIGNNTQRYLRHLLIVSLDDKAHQRCLEVHPHCYQLQIDLVNVVTTESSYKTPNYLKIIWRKIDLVRTVLELGFNVLFTDGDIMWLRDPFSQLVLEDSNFQVACEIYVGDPYSLENNANTGFMYVASDPKTIHFYKLWYSARLNYNQTEDQEIFNIMKQGSFFQILGLKVKFLQTIYFNGFCQPTRDYNKVCTVHATCIYGLESKVKQLKEVLNNWRNYTSSAPTML